MDRNVFITQNYKDRNILPHYTKIYANKRVQIIQIIKGEIVLSHTKRYKDKNGLTL